MELRSDTPRPFASELRIVLVGKAEAKTNSVANAILGREAFETGPLCSAVTQHCERARAVAEGRRLTVISTPDLLALSPPALTQEVETCIFLSSPGPHVLVVVLQLASFTKEDVRRVKSILARWGDAALSHALVLIVPGPVCHNRAVQLLIRECQDRMHEFDDGYMTENGQVAQLVEKMEQVVRENEGRHLGPEARQESDVREDALGVQEQQGAGPQDQVKSRKSSSLGQPESVKSGSSPARDMQKGVWNLSKYKTRLPVTCGAETGNLYRDKLARGEKCIQVGTLRFTAPEFEAFAGKKNCKNWKKSILCSGTSLFDLIKEGHLKAPVRWRTETSQHEQDDHQSSSRSPQARTEGRRTPSASGRPRSLPSDLRREAMEVEHNGGDDEDAERHMEVDLSAFDGNLFKVTCGSAEGTLHKHRFATETFGKCIRTVDRWLTPMDFVKQDPTLTGVHWRRSILCLGTPLSFLIEKRVLLIHSLLCECYYCSNKEENLKEQENDDCCFICNGRDDLVCCDACPCVFHDKCHIPTLDRDILGDTWMCTCCVMNSSQQWSYPSKIPHKTALQKPIANHVLHCQYLLLFLYKKYQELCHTVKGHDDVQNKPTWLDKVVDALQSNHYTTVGEFESDIQWIFSNSSSSSGDNEFHETSAKLRDIFEEEFRKIFQIQPTC